MNRDEYVAMLEEEPATPNQRGAIMREFERLRFHPQRDRAERLATCARLLELDALGSTAELTMGQAGQLVKLLQRIRDRADLPGAPDVGDGQDHAPPDPDTETGAIEDGFGVTWPEVILTVLCLIRMIRNGAPRRNESGNIAPDIRRFRARGGIYSASADDTLAREGEDSR